MRSGRRAALASVPAPPIPNGWYCVALSSELAGKGVLSRRIAGHDVVVFRGESGRVGVLGAYCPHLGAHMGHGGRVEGESLRCPFHGFCFDPTGDCTKTGYGTRPPPKAQADAWVAEEKHGLVLVHYDAAGRPPAWRVPALDTTGFSPFALRSYTLRAHPQETTENSVDIGHFGYVHGYEDVAMIGEPVVDGPYLGVRYAFTRYVVRALGHGASMREQMCVHVYGLGHSVVEVQDQRLGMELRLLVLPTPVEEGRTELRIALSVRDPVLASAAHPMLRALPDALWRRMLPSLLVRIFAHDVEQDFFIWKNKRYIESPALAAGDGPVGLYRRWARQFYE